MLPARDSELVQIVDTALADATRRAQRPDGTSWLTCHPGCTPCCHGVFRISALDAERLQSGLQSLLRTDPVRAGSIQRRAGQLRLTLTPDFPGDAATGALAPEDETWDTFADLPEADSPCPVLDPDTGLCQLYDHRPLTCRVFGPPVMNEGGLGLCELCYLDASEADILHGEMHLHHQELETELNQQLPPTETLIAWALSPPQLLSEELETQN